MAQADDTLTLIDGAERHLVPRFESSAGPVVAPELLGWQLKPEGLCQGDVCVPLRTVHPTDGMFPLPALANLLGRPLVVDTERHVAAIGVSAASRREQMHSLQAPAFTLPDPQGNPVSLSDFGRRKRLLLAWSSW